MAKSIKVEFIADEFESSHGRMPKGRGSWAFSTERDTPVDSPRFWFSPSMTLGEAKRAAAEHFRALLVRTSTAPLTGDAVITLWIQP